MSSINLTALTTQSKDEVYDDDASVDKQDGRGLRGFFSHSSRRLTKPEVDDIDIDELIENLEWRYQNIMEVKDERKQVEQEQLRNEQKVQMFREKCKKQQRVITRQEKERQEEVAVKRERAAREQAKDETFLRKQNAKAKDLINHLQQEWMEQEQWKKDALNDKINQQEKHNKKNTTVEQEDKEEELWQVELNNAPSILTSNLALNHLEQAIPQHFQQNIGSTMTDKFEWRSLNPLVFVRHRAPDVLVEERQQQTDTEENVRSTRNVERHSRRPVQIAASTMSSNFEFKYPNRPVPHRPITQEPASTLTANFEFKYPNRPVVRRPVVKDTASTLTANFEFKYPNRPAQPPARAVNNQANILATNVDRGYPDRVLVPTKSVQMNPAISRMATNSEWNCPNRPASRDFRSQIHGKVSSLSANFEWKYPDRAAKSNAQFNDSKIKHQSSNVSTLDPNFEWLYVNGVLERPGPSSVPRRFSANAKANLDEQFNDVYVKKVNTPEDSAPRRSSSIGEALLASSTKWGTLKD